ncbi:uncharacterized protein ACJ7VT_006196 [Polymixia lowei]
MFLNMTGLRDKSGCDHNMTSWEQHMDRLYSYFYLFLFVPGLLLNTIALWVLCRHISKKTKAVIFMINLALADLAHVLSLPLRIYYYFTHTWPFGHTVCLLCFYLKYLNMYASIAFLVCISVQRCAFVLNPFSARRWRRRYDLLISIIVWLVVGLGCSPFIIMRSSSPTSVLGTTDHNLTYVLHATSTQAPMAYAKLYTSPLSARPIFGSVSTSSTPPKAGCFKDLPTRKLSLPVLATMIALAELFGFLLPLVTISYSSILIVRSLNQRQNQEQQNFLASLSPSARRRAHSTSSSACQASRPLDNQDKRRALQMVLSCSALFLVCFAPYHINFLFYLMVSQDIVSHCATRLAVLQFHPLSLCLASLSCCLNPLLYYFLTAEFRLHLTRRTSSFTSSLISSPTASSSQRPDRLMSTESTSSYREIDSTRRQLLCPRSHLWFPLLRGGSEKNKDGRSIITSHGIAWILTHTCPRKTDYKELLRYKVSIGKQGTDAYPVGWQKEGVLLCPWIKMSAANQNCTNSEDLRRYQHHVYAVVYSVILAPGLLGNVLALWVFWVYVKETKKAVVFMMNLAVADLMQVLSLPLRIYYYLNETWPFGHHLCMFCFYLKYVNMYASIFFLVCVSVRRCELIIRPLRYNSSKRKADICICAAGWLLVCLGCLPFPLLRNTNYEDNVTPPSHTTPHLGTEASVLTHNSALSPKAVCFSELPMKPVSVPTVWALMITAELVGFVLPLVLVLACTGLTAGSLREVREGGVQDRGEKRRALRMVLSCALVFLLCFAPYHITMPLDFLAKANALGNCALRELVLRCHPVTLCLASLNSTLDPLMYYFTTDEFWRRLSRTEMPESFAFTRRMSCVTGEDKDLGED